MTNTRNKVTDDQRNLFFELRKTMKRDDAARAAGLTPGQLTHMLYGNKKRSKCGVKEGYFDVDSFFKKMIV